MPNEYIQTGPIARALELVGQRWTILILQELLRGHHRFAELKDRVEGIAPNVLSDRLKIFERYDIVERRFYSEHPPRAEYHLTSKGHELGIVAGALAVWGTKHLSDDMVLVHAKCGSRMAVIYFCPMCKTNVRGSQVRLEDQPNVSQHG